MRAAILAGVLTWMGATLLLAHARWFARRPLADRLRLYTPHAAPTSGRAGLLSFDSFRDLTGPLARSCGERLSRLFGISEDLSTRLARINSPYDVTAFRVRQFGAALGALAVGGVVLVATRPPLIIGVLLLLGPPLLAFLVMEQHVAALSAARQRRLFLELPVVSEQLAMLLSAGYSLGAALNRIAARGRGQLRPPSVRPTSSTRAMSASTRRAGPPRRPRVTWSSPGSGGRASSVSAVISSRASASSSASTHTSGRPNIDG